MPLHRSRSGRAPPCAEGLQREPFSAGPFRQKATSSPSTTPARKGRQYGENQPPENVNLVRGNILEVASPALLKSASRKGKGHLASPALPPMPPSARASPAQAGYQPASAALLDTGAKRKLSWEVQSAGATEIAPTPDQKTAIASVTEANVADNGVKVIVRVRPLTHREQQEGEIEALSVSPQTISLAQQTFTFDAVAGSETTQNDLFNMVGIPMVNNCIAGFNSSIFAYGQTGSGKTYTMWGPTQDSISNIFPNESRGIAPRLFEQLFSRIQQEEIKHAASQLRYQCRCSFLEIYNEQITDLLEPSQKNLQIREDTKTGVYVENLTEEFVSGVNDITQLLLKGLANRSVGSTMMNNESSRSHSVFTCVIECRCKSVEQGVSSLRSSRMNLVDLAGSERQKQTGAAGERLKEAGNINRSLSQLGNVINILAEVAQSGKQRHIPYRDSRLTFLLQESLGGNAKLAMICSISTASSCRSETLSTLRFAKRAKAIQNKAVVNEETENDVNLLREQIRQLKEELMRMKASKAEQPSGWNPRRSYNLLRMSLNYPMAFPKGDLDSDSDEEMEIEDPVCQEHIEGLVFRESGRTGGAIRDQIMEIERNPADVPVCQGPGSVDGAIDEEIMEIDDDSAQVPVCQVPVGLDGATCEQIMDIEEDSADVPVYQEPGSADGGIGEESALMDLGSPFPDDSPSRLPLLGDHTRMGSCRLAGSEPYYDCKSVFDSCSHISLSGSFSSSSKYSSSVILFPAKIQVEPTMPRGYGGLDSVTTSEAGIIARRSSLPDQLPGELEDTLCSKMVCTSSVAIEDSPMMQQESRIQLNQAKEELSYAGVPPTSVDAGLHVEASTSSEDAGPEELPGNIDNPLALGTVSAPQRNWDAVQESLDDEQRRQSLMSERSIEALTIVEAPTTSQVASCVEASVTSEEAVVQSLHVVLPTLPLCAEGLSDTVEDPVGRGNFSLSHERLVELVDPAAQECPILLDESIEAFTCVEETTAGEDPAICVQASGLSDDEGTACLEMVLPMSVLKPAQLPHVYEEVAHMECSERTQDTEQVQQCPRFLNECIEELTFSEDPTVNQDGAICVEAFAAGEDAAIASLEMVVPAAQELQRPILLSESIEASTCAEETSAGENPAICVQASGLTEDEGTACLEMVLPTSALKAEQLPHVYEEVAHMECPETTQDTEGIQQCPRLLTECIEDTKDPEDPTANPDGVICVKAFAAGEDVTLASLDLSYQSIEAFACSEGNTAGEDPAICVQASTLSDDEVTPCLEMVLPTSPLKPEQLPHVYEEVAHMECPETTQDTEGVQQCPSLLTEWIEDTEDPEDPTANHNGAICVEAFAAGEGVTPASLEMVAPVAQELQRPILVSESIEALSCPKDPSASEDDTAICVEASGLSEDTIVLSLEVVVPTSPFGPEQLLHAYEDSSSVRQTECPTATQDADQVQQFSSSVNESIEPLTCTEDPSANEDTSNCVETSGVLEETMLPSFEMSLPTSPLGVVVLASPTATADPSDNLRYTRGAGAICAVGELPTLQTRTQTQLNKAVEALLAGAIRREEAAEEKVRRQAAEIEQLNRLVRQYKHERECNAILQQSREDKIARLESLMDGVLPSDAFLAHEWAALTNEHQVLLDKYDNHPEVTHSIIQQQRLIEELREYRDYFDLGEKEDMQKEIRQLRKQLQDFLDSGPPPRPLDSRRRSMLMQSISVRQSMSLRQSMCLRSSVAAPGALAICTDPQRFDESIGRVSEDLTMVVSEELYPETKKKTLQDDMKQLVGEQGLEGPLSPVGECSLVVTETECPEDKDREWEERENDWIAVLEELRLEADSYRRQAEMRTHELECERRCSEEVREALQMAMTGHARLLDQYAELQEKHISVLAKHRKIREGASDVRKMAKRAGVSQVDSRWLETQATKMAAMQADHEEERESMRQDMESLRAQLNDTAEAVQAAGELLVRLKESEEAVCIAQDAALLAEQDADALQRELEKAKRKHATEIAVLQQRLLESRLQKSTLCQMCVMAERVKFEFTEVDENTAQAEMEAEQRAAALQQVDQMAAAGQESTEEEHWVQSPVRYGHSADDWDYQSPARDNDPAAESRYDYYLDDYERGWRR